MSLVDIVKNHFAGFAPGLFGGVGSNPTAATRRERERGSKDTLHLPAERVSCIGIGVEFVGQDGSQGRWTSGLTPSGRRGTRTREAAFARPASGGSKYPQDLSIA